ncbi:MAG: hypothetical protein M3297_01510, partial [Thermoproteota archaeon]|nr:hypothetical protein [Thermoproteota archaeon]
QVTYPSNIFARVDQQAQLHELVLKATQENGQTNTVTGFKVDLTNVVPASANSELDIITLDNVLPVVEARVKSTSDTFTDLIKKNTNVFSLAELPAGVYTLDVIVQKQSSKAAYEGILVKGQPVNQATQRAVQREIVKQDTDVSILFEKPTQQQPRKPQTCATGWHLDDRNICQPDDQSNPALGLGALPPSPAPGSSPVDEPAPFTCQPEDDFCGLGCEDPSIDCTDDVNSGDDAEDSSEENDEEDGDSDGGGGDGDGEGNVEEEGKEEGNGDGEGSEGNGDGEGGGDEGGGDEGGSEGN